MNDEIINTDLLHHDQTHSDDQPAGIKTTIKELVRQIFGDAAANDNDIVSFYEEVNRTAMQDYVAQKDEANCFSLNEVMTMLADFAVLYYESKNKDIANDAAEYAWDEYKKKYGNVCELCSRIVDEEAHYCEITDCPHK